MGHPMGGSRLALLEAALCGSHGRARSPHHCRMPLEHVDVAATWMALRVPGPDGEVELPDQARWPHPVAGTTIVPLYSVQLWSAGALGRRTTPDVPGSPIIIVVDNDDEGDDSDDGVLGASGTNRGVAPGEREQRARAPGCQQDTTRAPRSRSSPAAQAQGPPAPQRCFVRRSFLARDGAARKRKPSADPVAITGPGTV